MESLELPRSKEAKIDFIAQRVEEILAACGLTLPETPERVARSLVGELWAGLDPEQAPELRLFEVPLGAQEVIVEGIEVQSVCEHHLLPFTGRARVAYRPRGRVLGISKVHRLVDYLARRPTMQERLTQEIADRLQHVLGSPDLRVEVEASHGCVSCRGVGHREGRLVTRISRGEYEVVR